MKTSFTFSVLCLLFSISQLSATTYTTIAAGDYDNSAIWDSVNAPPTTLPAGDQVIINHAVNLNRNLSILGKLKVNVGGSLIGIENIKVGKDGTTGQLINDGVISANEVDVKGINSSGSSDIPSITNNGSITAVLMDIGNDDGYGKLTNTAFGSITVSGDLHADNMLSNAGTITVSGTLKNHGGMITGGGTITNCNIELSDNGGRVASMLSQDICCDYDADPVVEPTFDIGPASYGSLAGVVVGEGLSSPEHLIESVAYYSCGINSEGAALPVELIDFDARENKAHYAVVYWSTASELNNKQFTIERSIDGRNFVALGVVAGAGTSGLVQTYTYVDKSPVPFAYYRLKQMDFDGAFEYSEVVTLRMKSLNVKTLDTYPTIAKQEVTIHFASISNSDSSLKIVDSYGRLIQEEEVNPSKDTGSKTLNVANFPNGVYHVILFDGVDYQTNHFIVSK